MSLLDAQGVTLIEDCAHTMGAAWNGKKSGSFGKAGCFSAQTYKHINSGEGGFLTSDDPDFMARAIVLSGSYMMYERHETAPEPSYFEAIRLDTPNCSGRMDNLRAAILRPQLDTLDENVGRWLERYQAVEAPLKGIDGVYVPSRPEQETFVGSSIQFHLPNLTPLQAGSFVEACKSRGVELKWFGDKTPVAFTSRHQSWCYVDAQDLPKSDAILDGLFDMRIPLTFSVDDCALIGVIIREELVALGLRS